MVRTVLTLKTPKGFLPDVRCNGSLVRFVKTARGVYSARLNVDENEALDFHVFKHYPLSDGLWFVYGLLFWIIGFFGIFTPRWEKKCPSLDVCFSVDKPTDIEMTINPVVEGERAISISGALSDVVDVDSNVFSINTTAQKRAKKVKLFSTLTFLACLIAGVSLGLYFYIN